MEASFSLQPAKFIHYTQAGSFPIYSVSGPRLLHIVAYYSDDPSSTYYHPKDKEAAASFSFFFSLFRLLENDLKEGALNKALSSDWLVPSSGDY